MSEEEKEEEVGVFSVELGAVATYYAGNKRILNAAATTTHCVKLGYDSAIVWLSGKTDDSYDCFCAGCMAPIKENDQLRQYPMT